MKQFQIFASIAIVAITAAGLTFLRSAQLSDLEKANIEALSQDEYVLGAVGTNWKTYRIQCQVTVGFDYIIVVTKTTTFWKDACGYGSGLCLSSTGC